jgi:hypothetical protein
MLPSYIKKPDEKSQICPIKNRAKKPEKEKKN